MLITLPDVLIALVVLLVLSASMSTLASLVLTSSSTMTLDLIYRDKKSLPGEVEDGTIDDIVAEKIERRKVVVMRVLIMFFIAISLLIALNPPESANVYRSAHGYLVGRPRWCVPRSLHVGSLLAWHHYGLCLGLFLLGCRSHGYQHACWQSH